MYKLCIAEDNMEVLGISQKAYMLGGMSREIVTPVWAGSQEL